MPFSPCVRLLAVSFFCLLVSSCSSGSSEDGLGAQNPVAPPQTSAPPPYTPVLLAAAAASQTVFLHWDLPSSSFEAALFQGEEAAQLYDETPVATGLGGDGMEIAGLVDGTTYFFGLGVREVGTSRWVPSGLVLRARAGAPYYVDAAADPSTADGTTPETAFASLATALAAALDDGVSNVLVKQGTYGADGLEVLSGLHVYGGFDETFALPNRDPQQ